MWESLCKAELPLKEDQKSLILELFNAPYIQNPKDYVYMIDVKLMLQDVEKIDCEQQDCKPIISMELFNFIKNELKQDYIIYSRYTYLNRVNDNWNYVYEKTYTDNHKVEILDRTGFIYGSIDKSYVKKLLRNVLGNSYERR